LYALSDPSVLIKNMLELSENHAFAYNLVSALARPGGRLIVVTQEFAERGTPRLAGRSASESGVAGTTQALSDFNHFLKDFDTWHPPDLLLRFLAVLASLVGGALMLGRLRSPGAPGTKWVRPFLPEAHAAADAALPALLREEIEERLERARNAGDEVRVRALARLSKKSAGKLTLRRGRRLAAGMERLG
jgi:hypothetical protein